MFKSIAKFFSKSPAPLPEFFTSLVASDAGVGVLTLTMRDETTKTYAMFPPIDLLLRRAEDMAANVELLRAKGAETTDLPIMEAVVEGVVATLGLDTPDSFTLLSESLLRRHRLQPGLARAGALARLRHASTDLVSEGGAGRYRVQYPENRDLTASFALVADEWLKAELLDGEPVLAIATRVSIHLCGANDTDSVRELAELAQEMYQAGVEDPEANGRPITPRLLTLSDGKLVFFGSSSGA